MKDARRVGARETESRGEESGRRKWVKKKSQLRRNANFGGDSGQAEPENSVMSRRSKLARDNITISFPDR